MKDNSKEHFVRTWGEVGYRENWDVYGEIAKMPEADFVEIYAS